MPNKERETYPREQYNIIMLCGHKLYQQLTLSSDSESRYNLLNTNVNPNTEPADNDKQFNIYTPYNIHKNARKYFIQWLEAIIKLCSEGRDLELYSKLAGSKIPNTLMVNLLGMHGRIYHSRHREYILNNSGFRAVVSPLVDRYDWMITYEKVGTTSKVYTKVTVRHRDNSVSAEDGNMSVITTKLPDEGPKPAPAPQEQQIRNDNYYVPPANDDNVIWMPTTEIIPDRGKRKLLASNNP